MAMILNGKYAATPHGNWIFYTNRIVKIFAPYLVILAATVGVCLISKATTGNGLLLNIWFAEADKMTALTLAFALLTNIFIVGQEWGFLLIYRAGSLFYDLHAFEKSPMEFQFTVIGPAWTLSIELLFYLIAPFVLRRHVLMIAALALASHLFRFGAYWLGYYSEATNYRFFPFELSLFLYGALCFRLGKFLPKINAQWATVTTLLVLVVVFVPGILLERQYQLYALVGLLLPALFDFSRRNSWDRSIGDLSYPLYLVHWPIAAFAAATIGGIEPDVVEIVAVYPVAVIVLAVGVAAAINRCVVDPLDHWRQLRVGAST